MMRSGEAPILSSGSLANYTRPSASPIIPQTTLDDVDRDLKLFPNVQFDYSTVPKTLLKPWQVFEDIKILGRGAFGEVHLVRNKSDGKLFALKYLLNPNPDMLDIEIGSLREISGYPNCEENIVCYYDAFQFRDKDGSIKYGVLMEYISGESLEKFIETHTIEPELLSKMALWLTTVLADLHAQGFTHRDIKPGNIMVTETAQLKLIDFGLTCTNREPDSKAPTCGEGIAGTAGYLPPDITRAQFSQDKVGHLQAADIFAAGVTLYNMANMMRDPYQLNNNLHITGNIRPSDYDYPCFNNIVYQMLNPDYKQRPTAAEANFMFQECILPY